MSSAEVPEPNELPEVNQTWITPTHWEYSNEKSAKVSKAHKLEADQMSETDYYYAGDSNDDLAQIEYLRHILHFLTCESPQPDLTAEQIIERKSRNINTMVMSFEEQVTDLEQHFLRKTIRIEGVPEEPGYENTFKVVKDFLSDQLNLEVQSRVMDVCYRCGDASSLPPRPIVVTFHDKHFLNKVLGKVKMIGKRKEWSVCEELCSDRRRVRSEAIKLFGPERVTVEDGIVVVRSSDDAIPLKFSTWFQFWEFKNQYPATEQ